MSLFCPKGPNTYPMFCCEQMYKDYQAAIAELKAAHSDFTPMITSSFRTIQQNLDAVNRYDPRMTATQINSSNHLKALALDITFGGGNALKTGPEGNKVGTPEGIRRGEIASEYFARHNYKWKRAGDCVHFDWLGAPPPDNASVVALLNGPIQSDATTELGKPIEAVITNQNDPILQTEHTKLNSRGLYDPTGIDTLPWYEDKNTLVGNKHLVGSPASFSINLKEFDLTNPLPNKDGGTDPLTLLLNCSLNTLSISMKHIINKANSRTGFHLTFWGMEPDTVSGSGSTGAFINQFGLTDIMSLMGIPTDLEDYRNTAEGTSKVGFTPESDLRVAAQDAFVELLSLFRNNGIIRYKADNYDPTDQTVGRDQLGQSVWSEKYGDSNFTRNARNNDVMVKGNVVMRFKSNIFHGYFKSLSWNMDADNPFQWKFDFVFQVQKSVSFVYYPE